MQETKENVRSGIPGMDMFPFRENADQQPVDQQPVEQPPVEQPSIGQPPAGQLVGEPEEDPSLGEGEELLPFRETTPEQTQMVRRLMQTFQEREQIFTMREAEHQRQKELLSGMFKQLSAEKEQVDKALETQQRMAEKLEEKEQMLSDWYKEETAARKTLETDKEAFRQEQEEFFREQKLQTEELKNEKFKVEQEREMYEHRLSVLGLISEKENGEEGKNAFSFFSALVEQPSCKEETEYYRKESEYWKDRVEKLSDALIWRQYNISEKDKDIVCLEQYILSLACELAPDRVGTVLKQAYAYREPTDVSKWIEENNLRELSESGQLNLLASQLEELKGQENLNRQILELTARLKESERLAEQERQKRLDVEEKNRMLMVMYKSGDINPVMQETDSGEPEQYHDKSDSDGIDVSDGGRFEEVEPEEADGRKRVDPSEKEPLEDVSPLAEPVQTELEETGTSKDTSEQTDASGMLTAEDLKMFLSARDGWSSFYIQKTGGTEELDARYKGLDCKFCIADPIRVEVSAARKNQYLLRKTIKKKNKENDGATYRYEDGKVYATMEFTQNVNPLVMLMQVERISKGFREGGQA